MERLEATVGVVIILSLLMHTNHNGFYTRVMIMHQRAAVSTKWTGGGVMTTHY